MMPESSTTIYASASCSGDLGGYPTGLRSTYIYKITFYLEVEKVLNVIYSSYFTLRMAQCVKVHILGGLGVI
jgi:hypothetical protein